MQNIRGSILLSCLLCSSFLSTEAQTTFTFKKVKGSPVSIEKELRDASIGLAEFLCKSYRPTIKLGAPVIASRYKSGEFRLKDAGVAAGSYIIYQLLKKEVEQSTGNHLALPTVNESCFEKDSYTKIFFSYVNKGIVLTNEGLELFGPLLVQMMLQKVASENNARRGAPARSRK